MDLVDRIETTRFLGGEFLLWLWFSRDVTGGEIYIKGRGTLLVSLETQLGLADPIAERERVLIRGMDPFGGTEAGEALAAGKLPRKVGLRIVFEQSEWVMTLDSSTLALSGVKLPALANEREDELLNERMRLLEQVHDLVQALYAHFLGVRLSSAWDSDVLPALRRWVLSGEVMDEKVFDRLHARRTARGTERSSV
jgi:recombination associated protein RdgC